MSSSIKSPTKLPNAITRVMSWVYGFGIGFVNRRYDRGVGVAKLDVPVISIGNLSAGGTGKTPMVHWVAQQLIDSGKNPVIAMRGYGAKPGEMGDEEREHREALESVPVVAQPDRIGGLKALFDSGEQVDCVILDDGFQHRKIARDLDIVLIDASSPPYGDALLPRGFLRESSDSISRADAVVITHREMVSDGQLSELVDWVREQTPGRPVAIASHVWNSVHRYTRVDGKWEAKSRGVEEFVGKRVLGVCAIGNPGGFFRQIEACQWDLAEKIELPDHHPFDDDEVDRLCRLASESAVDAICMTRKDWVKISDYLLHGDAIGTNYEVIVPELVMQFEAGESDIRSILSTRSNVQIW